jgi:hypothetical protein
MVKKQYACITKYTYIIVKDYINVFILFLSVLIIITYLHFITVYLFKLLNLKI